MAYQYGVGGASPMPHAPSPGIQRAVTPTPPLPGGPIQPGSITYTTTAGTDGQIIYHPFKAVSASYETPQGIVTGIQWVPAEATRMLPAGATPATADILASFNRNSHARDPYYDGDRHREEDRRREKELRREEKERRRLEREGERLERELRRARERDNEDQRPKRNSGYGYDRDYDRDLDRSFRDMDLRDRDREREREREFEAAKVRSRQSATYDPNTYATGAAGAYPASYAPASPTTSYAAPAGGYTAGQQYYPAPPTRTASQGVGMVRSASPYQPGAAPRPVSPYAPPPPARSASPYQIPGVLPRSASPYQIPGVLPRAASPYQAPLGPPRAASPYQPVVPRSASPYQGGGPLPPQGFYPPGHVMEGKPIAPRPLSRAPSPNPGSYAVAPAPTGTYGYGATQQPYGGAPPSYGVPSGQYGSPALQQPEQQSMPAPEGFSRPPNLSQAYTRFETTKIQDMDDFYENIPRMPLVLVPHDVYHEDWIRLMTDLSLAWAGKLPVPAYATDGRPPKRTTLTSDLIDLWNTSFFLKRGVELVLYKGRERRSGRLAGTVDVHLPGFEGAAPISDSSESSSSGSESEDDRDDRHRYGAYGGAYSRQLEGQLAELQETKRVRKERKRAEKKRRRQEKKQRKKAREAERKYAMYVTCVAPEL
ncbi:uncharacterized protein PHACADRAFT_249989 [Phanerochaete carnosa HHB-10118-sp]|uniref:Uncharacterized protein n=1 Tax=Phanerochaete carnosa (strain HHB-10118-sp) TaxID=650164 RepID=K5V9G6_PHACS|nr:uncharacterized protein PHACADRAFT_249989 [Phanerochaete carnosa HHB-10118-sp]EKM59471.1 hypothetical protein PHACADRAFT_249989 [Phanerochaete carnosa HHB-10118-sp]